MKRKARKFDLSEFKGLDIQSFVIKETDGEDLVFAAERIASPDGAEVDSNTYSLLLRTQMVAGAIVEVDGEPVKGASCQAFMKWNARTRAIVNKGYDHVNGNSKTDDALFQKLLNAPVGEESEQT